MKMRWVLLALVAIVAVGCGVGEKTAELAVTIGSGGLAQYSVVPGGSMDPEHYRINGVGSGTASGLTFTGTIPGAGGTLNVVIGQGDWAVTALAYNAAEEIEANLIGDSVASNVTVILGVPATVTCQVKPLSGLGTLNVDLGWVPDVLLTPNATVDLVKRVGGATASVPMVVDGPTHASGTAQLDAGWYTGWLRLYDNVTLRGGIVQSVRIAKSRTSTWTAFFTVERLNGSLDVQLEWEDGSPLDMTTNVPEGELQIFGGMSTFIDVGADVPANYFWYLDGGAGAVATGDVYEIDGDTMGDGERHYISCVAFSTDGKRGGDLQWIVEKIPGAIPEANYRIVVSGVCDTGNSYTFRVNEFDGVTVGALIWESSPWIGVGAFEVTSDVLPVGNYRVTISSSMNWVFDNYAEGEGWPGAVIPIPQAPAFHWVMETHIY